MAQVPLQGTPYAVNKNRFLSVAGIPCQAPPFGTLTAIDMKTQKVAWQVPVGTVEDTGPLGIRMHLPIKIGLPTLGGTLSTQGGLIFIAGTQDFYLRAFNSANGDGNLESPPTRRQPRRPDDLRLAENRQASTW